MWIRLNAFALRKHRIILKQHNKDKINITTAQ